ncbi:MAG: adenosylcobalamin-dependent ribonucleoside-diphosphate reductase [Candidatus Shapirobacteria bacterium]
MTQLSENALNIFKMLYSKNGETPEDTFRRAARCVSKNQEEEDLAVQLQVDNIVRFNTPLYFNAGGKINLFSACWVVTLEDSMNGIYTIANIARKIFSYGSGIGIPIGNLREKDAPIFDGDSTTIPCGQSSGPITFMKLYDAVAATTKSGGRARRAAILCAMQIWHPDILEFIQAKEIDGTLSNMNLSVTITDKFMQCLEDNIPFPLHTPYDGSFIKNEDPRVIWDTICKQAHKTGDPGVIFIDTVNKFNPLKKKILIETTNVCGEQPLRAYEGCALAMINVAKFVKEDMTYDWDGLFETARNLTTFMNNMINIMDFPDEKFREQSVKYKPIGIGPAGLSDAMFLLGLRYNGKDGKDFAAEVMRTITHGSIRKSIELAKELGPFHQYDEVKDDTVPILESLIKIDDYDEEVINTLMMLDEYGIHNVQHTTCMPTGTTAISCDVSYGIEPCFGLVYEKNLMTGKTMKMINPIFEQKYKNESWFTNDLIEKIFANGGSLKNIRGVPKEVKEVFVTAHDIKPKDRIEMQSAIAKHCSTAISSTVNLPSTAAVEEISEIYKLAYDLGLKGVTVYRDGCKKNQPVTFKKEGLEVVSNFERPSKLNSIKHCIQLADGKLYVDVVKHEGRVVEIWFDYGKSGQEINGLLEALGKSLSTGVQHGVPTDAYIKQFKGIRGESPIWFKFEDFDKKPVQLHSIPDALAKLLERYYKNDETVYNESSGFETETCPKCQNNSVMNIEGCKTCNSCGYSRCS